MLSMLLVQLLLQVLGESTEFVSIWMIQGSEGVGDIPGVQGVQGGSEGSVTICYIFLSLCPTTCRHVGLLLSSIPHPLTGTMYFYNLILLLQSHLVTSRLV